MFSSIPKTPLHASSPSTETPSEDQGGPSNKRVLEADQFLPAESKRRVMARTDSPKDSPPSPSTQPVQHFSSDQPESPFPTPDILEPRPTTNATLVSDELVFEAKRKMRSTIVEPILDTENIASTSATHITPFIATTQNTLKGLAGELTEERINSTPRVSATLRPLLVRILENTGESENNGIEVAVLDYIEQYANNNGFDTDLKWACMEQAIAYMRDHRRNCLEVEIDQEKIVKTITVKREELNGIPLTVAYRNALVHEYQRFTSARFNERNKFFEKIVRLFNGNVPSDNLKYLTKKLTDTARQCALRSKTANAASSKPSASAPPQQPSKDRVEEEAKRVASLMTAMIAEFSKDEEESHPKLSSVFANYQTGNQAYFIQNWVNFQTLANIQHNASEKGLTPQAKWAQMEQMLKITLGEI
jgi:hypothetical protein